MVTSRGVGAAAHDLKGRHPPDHLRGGARDDARRLGALRHPGDELHLHAGGGAHLVPIDDEGRSPGDRVSDRGPQACYGGAGCLDSNRVTTMFAVALAGAARRPAMAGPRSARPAL